MLGPEQMMFVIMPRLTLVTATLPAGVPATGTVAGAAMIHATKSSSLILGVKGLPKRRVGRMIPPTI